MKQTMSTYQIADALRADDNANWSYNGAKALAEYLEQYEEDTGGEMEFDRVAIRCDFSEYGNATEAADAYGFDVNDDFADSEIEVAALKYLEDRTTVIRFNGGIIIQDF